MLRRVFGVAGALLGGRHVAHDVVDVFAAATPGGLLTARALDGIAHDFLLGPRAYADAVSELAAIDARTSSMSSSLIWVSRSSSAAAGSAPG